jgi:predicted acylesterase/phospholipase RssA
MSKLITESQSYAREIIAGKKIVEETERDQILGHVEKLKGECAFGLARRMLEIARNQACYEGADEAFKRKFIQKLSLCTYKDPDLNPHERLDRALKILDKTQKTIDKEGKTREGLDVLDLKASDCTKDQETLGQVGAIYKRKWELTGQNVFLERSLAYYQRGYEQGVAKDYGYTAINAAFVLDLLAQTEVNEADRLAKTQRAENIRQDIIEVVAKLKDPGQWWFPVTIAEAYFGMRKYDEAKPWLQKAAALTNVHEWEREATARQLARLLYLHEIDATKATAAKQVLIKFLGISAAGLESLLRGKIGLGLSGGGFRASLFHIGTLARLAELDLLRDVEYISCVSGGSIIGAHYYLEVRNLLQSKADNEITQQDYIDIVKRIEKDFLEGVQTNVRVRMLSEWGANAKMIFTNNYSRTNRLGELYEEKIFAKINSAGDADSTEPLFLNKLQIQPKGENLGFSPKDQNWCRAAKVPILILNATPLNTGHNWQFTTTWMGEPPAGTGSVVDANYRLRRMYYEDAPEPHKNIRLGYAVAASSCVPGLFEPLPLDGLYGDKKVLLVDGGVHDNQGADALLEQGCNVLLMSDGSGQIDAQDQPSKGLLAVPLRANSILQARLRESQYQDLDARRRSGLLQGMMFIHLKQCLESLPVDWIKCPDPSDPVKDNVMLPYGVHREVQKKLAAIRTDLDSFSDAEAYALMTSAYLMTEHALKDSLSTLGFATKPAATQSWNFLKIKPEMQELDKETSLLRQLAVADKLFLRSWMLLKPLKIFGLLTVLSMLAVLIYLSSMYWNASVSISWGHMLSALLVLAISATAFKPVVQALQWQKTLQDVLVGTGMVIAGSLLAKLHLTIFDRLFLWQGKLR